MPRGVLKDGCPWITVEVIGRSNLSVVTDVIVDTGFNGYLALPLATVESLNLEVRGVESGIMADGSASPSVICSGKIVYAGKHIDTLIEVQENARPLLGTSLLKLLRMKFTIDVIRNIVSLEDIH